MAAIDRGRGGADQPIAPRAARDAGMIQDRLDWRLRQYSETMVASKARVSSGSRTVWD